tara:strand:- start:3141 stop:4031 length:891 start_codon:yes stop_codon:yes gene_type:complete
MSKKLIYIAGPTAIGKTSIAIKLAKKLSTEIISCDSRQFYKEMAIGTAVPNKSELNTIKHHFIQDRSIKDPLNVGDFERLALKVISKIFCKSDYALMVGGSGLYADSIIFGLDDFPKISINTQNKLNILYKESGLKGLQQLLKEKDLEYYNTVDLNNHHRLLRALSVCLESNKPYSIFLGKSKSVRNFKTKIFILHESRELLYKKINLRVDQMISNGLEGECKSLIKLRHLRPLQTVGYNEFFSYLDGNFSREFIIEEIKKNTRRYAKRQITWLKKYKTAEWINPKDASANILTNL